MTMTGMMMSAVRSPDERGAPAAEVEHRPAERTQHEARIRETDDETVVPAKRLQELAFLDYRHADPCITGNCLSHHYLPLVHESVVNGRAGEP